MQIMKYESRIRRGIGALAAAAVSAVAAVVLLTAPAPAVAASHFEPIQAEVPVAFAVSGDKADKAPAFSASMVAAEGETIQPDRGKVAVAGAGKATFTATFDEVGEHRYTVTQTTSDTKNWTLDTRVYDVTAYCMWEESTDSLFTKVVVNDSNGFKADDCTFVNSYEAPSSPSGLGTAGWMPKTGDVAAAKIAGVGVVGALVVAGGIALHRRGKRAGL